MRYIIGIDLGTTNSCVAFVDTHDVKAAVQIFKIPQLVAEGLVEAMPTLPSFCYLAGAHEWAKEALSLPWPASKEYFVGIFARSQGAKVPTRLVQSAKSWLCHPAANRRDKILPLEAAEEGTRVSPVEVTARYLRHIREAWNYQIGKGDVDSEFDSQEVVLTVPASFDEVARALTVEAARLAGFVQMTLLEEPQAAFYSWIAHHEGKWHELVEAGSTILVCDVGGGTTDFSLIETIAKGKDLAFQRMAVGNHLLLGGDNIDAAIAHLIEIKLENKIDLNNIQRQQLIHQAREAKEALMKGDHDAYRIVLQGIGSSVVKGTSTVELTRQEVRDLILKGFFGQYEWEEALKLRKTAGFRSMGLPYEDEPSITKQLAHFLNASGSKGEGPKKPDFILFNGGTVKPDLFQKEIFNSLQRWFPDKPLVSLTSYNLDLAVARGAAYYGKARRGLGVTIGGGAARGYYLIVDVKEAQEKRAKALTLLPRGSEEGDVYEPDKIFMLKPNTPVSFQLCTSHVRLNDKSGDLVSVDPEEMQPLPQIQTILRFGKKHSSEASDANIPVKLHITLTPIGTIELSLRSVHTEHKWTLEFQVRSASGVDNSLASLNTAATDETFQAGYLKNAEGLILQMFNSAQGAVKPERLMEKLEETLGISRREWSPSILRGLADAVLKISQQRKVSAEYGARWWNLVGFLLRPGFGFPLDDFRIKELWKVILHDYKIVQSAEVQIQMWICYRRIAGGLNKGQQTQLANDLIGQLLSKKNDRLEIKSKADIYPYSEKIRAFAALELVENTLKIRVANALTARICGGEGSAADYWALGRIGARHLIYGSIVNVVSREQCQKWVEQLMNAKVSNDENLAFLCGQLARKTEHRELNLSSVEGILARFQGTPQEERLRELLLKENCLSQSEQEQAFGDRLPPALLLEV